MLNQPSVNTIYEFCEDHERDQHQHLRSVARPVIVLSKRHQSSSHLHRRCCELSFVRHSSVSHENLDTPKGDRRVSLPGTCV